jgi:hypothetical protein
MEQEQNDRIDFVLLNDLRNQRRRRRRPPGMRLERLEPTDVLSDRVFRSHYRFDKAG